jgi:hypothetical protein
MRSQRSADLGRALVVAQVIADHVARQGRQPRGDRAARRVVVVDPGQRRGEGVLDDVLGQAGIAPGAVEHEGVEAVDVLVVQAAQGVMVPGRRGP